MQLCGKCTKFYEGENCPFCNERPAPMSQPEPVQAEEKTKATPEPEKPAPPKKKKGKLKKFLILVFVVFAFFWVYGFFFLDEEQDESTYTPTAEVVEYEAEVIVEEDVEDGVEEPVEDEPEEADQVPEPVDPVLWDYVLLFEEFGFMDDPKWVTITGVLRGGGLFVNYGFSDDIDGTIRFSLVDEDLWENFTDGDAVTVTGLITSAALGVMFMDYCIMTHATEYEIARIETFANERVNRVVQESVDFRASAITPHDQENILRNPASYEGTIMRLTAYIEQEMVGGLLTRSGFRAMVDGYEWFIDYSVTDGDPRILVGDTVTFYGEFAGLTRVTRALTGATEYVPQLNARYR